MPLAYALVARASDGAALAQHAAIPGNFEAVARECLLHSRRQGVKDDRFVVPCDGYAFSFLLRGPFAFVVAADAATGQQLPLACAARIAEQWASRFGDGAVNSAPAILERGFGPVLKREVEYCEAHGPEVLRGGASFEQALARVKGTVVANLASVYEGKDAAADAAAPQNWSSSWAKQGQRGGGGADAAGKAFQEQGARVQRRICCNSLCLKLFGAAAVGMLVTVVLLAACFAPPGTNRCRVKSSADGTVPGALPGAAEAELAAPPLPPAAPDAAAAAVPPASPDATPPPSPDAPPGAVPPPSPGAATPPADSFVDSAAAAPAADAAAAAAPATDAATTPAAADAAAATPADVAGPPAAGPMTPDVRRRFGPMPWVPSIDEYCAKPENEPQPPCFFAWCNDGNNTLTPADEAACATYEQWCTEDANADAPECTAPCDKDENLQDPRCQQGADAGR